MVMNSIWSFQKISGMPRVAAIEFPMGRGLGDVGDAELHRDILLATLDVFIQAKLPGWVEHLPFKWPHPIEETTWLPDPPPPYLEIIRESIDDIVARIRERSVKEP